MSTFNDQLTDFSKELLSEAMFQQGLYRQPFLAFEAAILDKISDLLDIEEPIIADCIISSQDNKILGEIHGYAMSTNSEVLHLFYSIYDSASEISTKNNSDCQAAINRAQGFYRKAIQNTHDEYPRASMNYNALKYIYDNSKTFKTVNIVLLTNGLARDISIKTIRINDKNVLLDVWDLKRIYDNTHSLSDHLVIDVDFESDLYKSYKIPFIQMESNQYGYKCIQALLPARLLYQLYERYNTNLLYNNVRYFLGLKKKGPNQSMLMTLRNNNEMFLAYNNGITALARDIDAIPLGEKKEITETGNTSSSQYITMGFLKKLYDFRIVNGGQTTATIFSAKQMGMSSKKSEDKVNLMGVFVQAKIIISDKIEELSSGITKSTNFQNQVKAGEFSASNSFNRKMEQLSRTLYIPTKPTEHTFWYYERLKGQYDEERKRITTRVDQSVFEKTNPKKWKFSKEEMAKVWMSWKHRPHDAVKGATTTYMSYMKDIMDSQYIPDEKYFHATVSLLMIYRYLLNREGAKSYGNGKATTVAYTMAMLNYLTFERFNLEKIWERQEITLNTKTFLNELSDSIFHLLGQGASALNSTILSYGKNKTAYENVKRNIEMSISGIQSDLCDV